MIIRKYKQPKNKLLRLFKYAWLCQVRNIRRDERLAKKGMIKCEICWRSEEHGYYICPECFRCNIHKPYCLTCNPDINKVEYCNCCGHKID